MNVLRRLYKGLLYTGRRRALAQKYSDTITKAKIPINTINKVSPLTKTGGCAKDSYSFGKKIDL